MGIDSLVDHGYGPGCERHKGDPHNLCETCWELEPDPLVVLGPCPHGVDLDRDFCPEGCRV